MKSKFHIHYFGCVVMNILLINVLLIEINCISEINIFKLCRYP